MNKLIIIKIGGMNIYCKTFTYSWNNSTNNHWKYALKHFEKWVALLCKYASNPKMIEEYLKKSMLQI